MDSTEFGFAFIEGLVEVSMSALDLEECAGANGGPYLDLVAAKDSAQSAGYLRLWSGAAPIDRMIHVRLQGDPADTHLFFLFGRRESVMPHFHGQVVQFAPDACVYNADLLPRLDPVDHPAYYESVFGPITKPYWQATQKPENACATAPGNPAIAAYLSPWSIGAGRPTNAAELNRVSPHIRAYLDHYIALTKSLDYPVPDAELMRSRDERHLNCFFAEHLDRRAWKGVYSLVGEEQGHRIREILIQELAQS